MPTNLREFIQICGDKADQSVPIWDASECKWTVVTLTPFGPLECRDVQNCMQSIIDGININITNISNTVNGLILTVNGLSALSHTHANKTLLDSLISSGSATYYLGADWAYHALPTNFTQYYQTVATNGISAPQQPVLNFGPGLVVTNSTGVTTVDIACPVCSTGGWTGGLDCSTVMSCPWILSILSDISTLEGDVNTLQWDVTTLQWQIGTYNITVRDEWLQIDNNIASINFTGLGITATSDWAGNIIVTVIWGGGTVTCEDIVACIEWAATLHLQSVTMDDMTMTPGGTVDRNGSTQTGATTMDSGYTATFEAGSTSTYDDGAITNQNGDVNMWATAVTTHAGDTVTGAVNQTNLAVTNTNVDTTNDAGSSITNNGNTTTNNSSTTNNTGTTTENWASTTIQNVDGTTNYTTNAVTNHTGDTTNNTNVTENYTSVFTPLGCTGAQANPYTSAVIATVTKADVTVAYDNWPWDSWSKVVTITPASGLITVTNTGMTGAITLERALSPDQIEAIQTSGAGTSTVDICKFSGGSIINNNGTLINNDNTVTNNSNVTENYTDGSTTYYDNTTTVVMEGDTNITNLTVQNISYQESYVAGEALTNRMPLRFGVTLLGEDPAKVYQANATDADHSAFVGFAGRNAAINEELPVLQGPRVSWLEAVYGALVDTSTYYLTDLGGIGLIAWTVSVRIGDADGDDTLVGINAPISFPQVQSWYIVSMASVTPAYNSYNVVTNSASDTTINLPTAVWHDGQWIKVKKLTGEDVRVTTVVPFGAELIDGFTGATMNINRTMYTFTAVAGNWYLGD